MTVALRCVVVAIFALSLGEMCGAAPVATEPREWTDRQGRKITARLEEIKGRNVVLNVDGDLVTVPLSQLSESDRAFVRGDAPAEPPPVAAADDATKVQETPPEPRAWRIHQRQVIGVLAGADERGFQLLVNDRPMRVGYEVLADEEDATALVNYLTLAGQAELAEAVIATYEGNTGNKYPRPSAANTDAKPTSPDSDEPAEPDPSSVPNTAATDTVIGIVPPVLPAPPPAPKFRTADQVLQQAPASTEPSEAALKKFHRTTMWAAFVLVGVVAAVITYGWMTLRRAA